MEYKILNHHSAEALEKHVTDHLKLGWKAHGSLFVHDNKFYQTVIKDIK